MKSSWMMAILGLVFCTRTAAALEPMSDEAMSDVRGREFFVSDYIAPNTTDANQYNNFSFYRLMLNANLKMNANIEHLQLGCGGINNQLDSSVCDVDMEHVRLMGRGATGSEASQPGDEGSTFELTRPYFEFAINNDDTKTQREVAGIKFGSQQVDGYMGVGRYNPDASGCTEAQQGSGALACHSGLNSISGFLNVDMSATIETPVGLTCFGITSRTDDSCGPNADGNSTPFITTFSGTRMKNITLLNKSMATQICILGSCLNANADIRQSLKMIHGFSFNNTSDFFMSFQRERIAWPEFVGPGESQSYAQRANTGWWFNVPYTRVRDAQGSIDLGLGELFSALSEGVNVVNAELGQRPPDNCYGTPEFC